MDELLDPPPVEYTQWYRHYAQVLHTPPPDPFERVKQDAGWASGVRRLRTICEVVLLDASTTFKLHSVQLEAFLCMLPTMLPVIFGVGFFRQYACERNDLYDLLQVPHDKMMFIYIGSRRDGKSVVLALAIAGLVCIGPLDVNEVPLFGPSEMVPIRLLALVAGMLKISAIKARLERVYSAPPKVTQKKITIGRYTFKAYAPTQTSLRGISPKWEAIDELFVLASETFQKLFIARYPETAVGSCSITTPRGDQAWSHKFHKSREVCHVLYRARICPECNALVQDSPEQYKMVEEQCWRKGHVEVRPFTFSIHPSSAARHPVEVGEARERLGSVHGRNVLRPGDRRSGWDGRIHLPVPPRHPALAVVHAIRTLTFVPAL